MGSLDQAINGVTAAEAKLNADQSTLSNIDAAIAQAQQPRPAAAQAVADDTTAFNGSLDLLIAAAQAAKIPVTTTDPNPPSSGSTTIGPVSTV